MRLFLVVGTAAALLLPGIPAAAQDPSVVSGPAFTEVRGFATKTGFRAVIAWAATEPIAATVAWGDDPGQLDRGTHPTLPDTADMAVIDAPLSIERIYYEVRDTVTGARSGIRSVDMSNAETAWDGAGYTFNLLVQLDTQALPPDVPHDQALEDLAAGINVMAERVYDALDGYARLGTVLITDALANSPAMVPGVPLRDAVCPEGGSTPPAGVADLLVETAPPLDSHTFHNWAIASPCTAMYVGRVGSLLPRLWDDLHFGDVAAHEFIHYAFSTEDQYGNAPHDEGCRNARWDGSIMHNDGGFTGRRWLLTELDRNATLTPCREAPAHWSWDRIGERYPRVPSNAAGPIDHVFDVQPRGNPDGAHLEILILDRQPHTSTLRSFEPLDHADDWTPLSERQTYRTANQAACGQHLPTRVMPEVAGISYGVEDVGRPSCALESSLAPRNFYPLPTDRRVDVQVTDDAGLRASGRLIFRTEVGAPVGVSTPFCQVIAAEIPPGAWRIEVSVDPSGCTDGAAASPSGSGTITVRYSSDP